MTLTMLFRGLSFASTRFFSSRGKSASSSSLLRDRALYQYFLHFQTRSVHLDFEREKERECSLDGVTMIFMVM